MEFQKFFEEKQRMCEKQRFCCYCPLTNNEISDCGYFINKNPKEAEEIVQKWSEEHPMITNADKFKEVFGHSIDSCGAPYPPALTVYGIGTMSNTEWLNQEYKEPKKESD